MYKGAILHLIGGKIELWYYKYYNNILHNYFRLNTTDVFKQIANLTKKGTKWYNKKISVKLNISNKKINKIKITYF